MIIGSPIVWIIPVDFLPGRTQGPGMAPTGATGLGHGPEAGQLGARPAAAQTKARPWRATGYLPTSELTVASEACSEIQLPNPFGICYQSRVYK